MHKTGGVLALPEMNRTIPKIFHQDKERLYDEAMKLKVNNNAVRDENLRLKTRLKVLENELQKKDRLLDEFSYQPQENVVGTKDGKGKSETHLTNALKRQVKELKMEVAAKDEENQKLRRNIKATKLHEFEVEMKMYVDECTRLRHMLEEVVRSKDPLADPEELANIEEHFQQQNILIQNIKQENAELASVFQQKEEECKHWKEVVTDMEKKLSKQSREMKENKKVRKNAKDKEKEINKLRQEVAVLKKSSSGKDQQQFQTE